MTQDVQSAGARSGTRTRRCLASGEVLPDALLMRFVSAPDGAVVPDVASKLPGRGLWVRATHEALSRAMEKNLFSRAAGASLTPAADLVAQTEKQLAAQLLSLLGLARRSGALLLGFDAIERAFRSGEALAVVVQAAEAASDGSRKLQAAALAAGRAPYVVGSLGAEELSLALGKANVVHAALKPGRIAEKVIFDAGRLAGFRPQNTWIWTGFKGQA